jgi:hypothetical protein
MYNLVNIVTSPTRITSDSISLVDVSITNKQYYEVSSTVLDLGYSQHQSQIWHMNVDKPKRGPVKVRKRLMKKVCDIFVNCNWVDTQWQ